jgi:hypothetical protein
VSIKYSRCERKNIFIGAGQWQMAIFKHTTLNRIKNDANERGRNIVFEGGTEHEKYNN